MIIQVASETNPNTVYDVHVNAAGVATGCSCPSARWRSVSCKHVIGVNHGQAQVAYLSRRARYQVLAPVSIALMDAIHAVVSQGPTHHPTCDQIEALRDIVSNIAADPWGDVEREVLGGLLTALTAA